MIVAEINPKGYKAQDLQLSAGATDAFRSDYRKGRGDKAMATAASTGDFGIGKGDAAAVEALANCAKKNDATDCEITIAN